MIRPRPLRLVAAVVLLGAALPGSAVAVDRFVAVGGTATAGSGCTSVADPCGSIGAAVAAAGADDHVKIAAGSYPGFWFNSVKNGLLISGGWNAAFTAQRRDPSATRVVAGEGQSAIADNTGGVATHTLANLTLVGGDLSLQPSTAVDKEVILHEVVIRDSPRGGINVSFQTGDLRFTLANCLIHGNAVAGNGSAVRFTASHGATVELVAVNTTVSGNHSDSGSAVVTNTAFASPGAVTIDFINSIVRGNVGGYDIYAPGPNTTVQLSRSIYGTLGPSPANFVDNGGNVNADPRFWPGDYRLRPDSPARGIGLCGFFFSSTYIRVAPYLDFEGQARPGFGALLGCDAGADQAPLFEDRFELGHLNLWSVRVP